MRRAGVAAAVAAALGTAFAVPWFAASPPRAQAGLPVFQLSLTRASGSAVVELDVPADAEWYALELEAPLTERRCCRVVIEDGVGAQLWQSNTEVVEASGLIRVLLSRSYFDDGNYRIVLYASDSGSARLVEHEVLVRFVE